MEMPISAQRGWLTVSVKNQVEALGPDDTLICVHSARDLPDKDPEWPLEKSSDAYVVVQVGEDTSTYETRFIANTADPVWRPASCLKVLGDQTQELLTFTVMAHALLTVD